MLLYTIRSCRARFGDYLSARLTGGAVGLICAKVVTSARVFFTKGAICASLGVIFTAFITYTLLLAPVPAARAATIAQDVNSPANPGAKSSGADPNTGTATGEDTQRYPLSPDAQAPATTSANTPGDAGDDLLEKQTRSGGGDASDTERYTGIQVIDGSEPTSSEETTGAEDDANCSIVLHDMPQINLVSEKLTIPIRVINTCPSEKQVHLSAYSDDDSRLEVMDTVDSTLKPNSENVLDLAVHAKSNGDSRLTITLQSVDGKSSSIAVDVHSLRDIGKAMSLLFFAGVSLLVVGGVWRTVRRRRRSKDGALPGDKPKKKAACCAKGS